MKSLVFDFDGVIGNTFEASAEFISKYTRVNIERARKILIYDGLANRKEGLLYKLVRNWYYKKLQKFFQQKESLIFNDKLEQILTLWPNNPKAILTRSDSRICRLLLGDRQDHFEFIIGREQVKTKLKGFQLISLSNRFKPENCIFITDSVGDFKEMSKVLKTEQIYVVNWGFQPLALLERYIEKERIVNDFYEIETKHFV